jgi:uncharacterized protein with von Willebrand factor type A (vWA) domain
MIRNIVTDRMFPVTLDGIDRAMRCLRHRSLAALAEH